MRTHALGSPTRVIDGQTCRYGAGARRHWPVSQMSVQEFEAIASAAPETVTLEFLTGRIGVKKVPGPMGIELDTEILEDYVR
ncbi:hypothetical protein SUDANB180_03697 [Streptomyces sp. enrichment culture]